MTKKTQVGILGAGTMGVGVAHVFAEYGYSVILVDTNPNALKKFDHALSQSYRTQCFLGKPQAKLESIQERIQTTTQLQSLETCDYLIDNSTESSFAKEQLLSQLKTIIKPDCLVIINTSCIPITSLAQCLDNPGRLLGIHFMNPAPVKSFVEIIKTRWTSKESLILAIDLLKSIGKSGNVVQDSPGFVINRVFMVTINEAIKVYDEQASVKPEEIDELYVKCLGHKMGPLMTADLIGLDTILYSLKVLHEELKQDIYLPAKRLVSLVTAGKLGRKTGAGIYHYG